MACPRCGQELYTADQPCKTCGYKEEVAPAWASGGRAQPAAAKPASAGNIYSRILKQKMGPEKPPELIDCPECRQTSMFYNRWSNLYECLNARCLATSSASEVKKQSDEDAAKRVQPKDDSDKNHDLIVISGGRASEPRVNRTMNANVAIAVISVLGITVCLLLVLFIQGQRLPAAKAQSVVQPTIQTTAPTTNAISQIVTPSVISDSTLQIQFTQAIQKIQILESQISQAQGDNTQLKTQLAQAQVTAASLQKQLSAVNDVFLVQGKTSSIRGQIFANNTATVPIDLKQNEHLQGNLVSAASVTIENSSGLVVKDLGKLAQEDFVFVSAADDRYTLVLKNAGTATMTYNLSYTVFTVK